MQNLYEGESHLVEQRSENYGPLVTCKCTGRMVCKQPFQWLNARPAAGWLPRKVRLPAQHAPEFNVDFSLSRQGTSDAWLRLNITGGAFGRRVLNVTIFYHAIDVQTQTNKQVQQPNPTAKAANPTVKLAALEARKLELRNYQRQAESACTGRESPISRIFS